MPTIYPFLSATKDDLDEDCRPEALRAVNAAGGVAITMETWDTEYLTAVKVCRGKIGESTHYIGIFAYRRGWTPPGLQKSITESEFDWAEESGKPMAVFLPKPNATFSRKLEKRASKQSDSDAKLQQAFLRRVKEKTCQLFETPADLSIRVALRVERWLNDIRSQPVVQPGQENKSKSGWRIPDEVEINKLGRTDHERHFEDTLNAILRPGCPRTVCFLIHGSNGYGHSRLTARFRKKLETRPETKQYAVAIGAGWQTATSERLIQIIGSTIDPNSSPVSIDALAQRLNKLLKEGDVVLEISNIQRLAESPSNFTTTFWQPLVAALGEGSLYRLIVLATLEDKISRNWEQYVQPPLRKKSVAFDPKRLVKLPKLQCFTEEEMCTWLQNGGWIKPEAVEDFARVLITETRGIPEMLCLKLADNSTWNV